MRLADRTLGLVAEESVDTPANLQIRNGDAAYSAVSALVHKVFAKAGLDEGHMARTHACFGMAGARLASARRAFEQRSFPFASTRVVDDIDIARAGAHLGGDGAVLIIGTGSAGLAIVDGQRFQVGGWGFHLGDAMSGAILGRRLLRYSLAAAEGLEKASPLTRAVMARFGDDPGRMMAWSFENPDALEDATGLFERGLGPEPAGPVPARPADYGAFVPLIFEYLEQGDETARQLMEFELKAIDAYVKWFTGRGAKTIAVVGGLGTRLMPVLKQRYPGIIIAPKADPLQGAVILASGAAFSRQPGPDGQL